MGKEKESRKKDGGRQEESRRKGGGNQEDSRKNVPIKWVAVYLVQRVVKKPNAFLKTKYVCFSWALKY